MKKMTIYDVDPTELIEEVSKELTKVEEITLPQWAIFVKTGAHKERPPAREDWWYVRAASVLRKVRLKGPIGVSKLRLLYGGIKNRGHQPEKFKKGSGNIIRKILQQLEKAELIKKDSKGAHKGRIITTKGIKLMDNAAKKISGNKPVEKKETKKEEPKDIKSKVEKLAKKTKEFAQGKTPTAQKLVEEASKETKGENKPDKEEAKKETKENVPTVAELAEKKESKKNG